MKTRVDERFRAEAARLRFRFACEDCVHFDSENEACTLGFPATPRLLEPDVTALELCKSFELL